MALQDYADKCLPFVICLRTRATMRLFILEHLQYVVDSWHVCIVFVICSFATPQRPQSAVDIAPAALLVRLPLYQHRQEMPQVKFGP